MLNVIAVLIIGMISIVVPGLFISVPLYVLNLKYRSFMADLNYKEEAVKALEVLKNQKLSIQEDKIIVSHDVNGGAYINEHGFAANIDQLHLSSPYEKYLLLRKLHTNPLNNLEKKDVTLFRPEFSHEIDSKIDQAFAQVIEIHALLDLGMNGSQQQSLFNRRVNRLKFLIEEKNCNEGNGFKPIINMCKVKECFSNFKSKKVDIEDYAKEILFHLGFSSIIQLQGEGNCRLLEVNTSCDVRVEL